MPDIPDRGRIDRTTAGRPPRIVQADESIVEGPASRITVVESIVFNMKGGQPLFVNSKFGRNQTTDEQPYQRIVKVTGEWARLDPGWVKVAGMMILSNEEGKFRQRTPTPEEVAATNSKIVEVWFEPPGTSLKVNSNPTMFDPPDAGIKPAPFACLLLPPGETLRGCPADVNVWLRCRNGDAKVIATLLPG